MALINLDNFVEPFRRPVHLVSILLITAIIGVWRASGGKVELERITQDENKAAIIQTEVGRPSNNPTINRPTTSQTKNSANSDFDSLLRKPLDNNQNSENAKPREKSALEDIEKSLGLR